MSAQVADLAGLTIDEIRNGLNGRLFSAVELARSAVEFAEAEGGEPLDFSHMGAVLAHGILAMADPVTGRAR